MSKWTATAAAWMVFISCSAFAQQNMQQNTAPAPDVQSLVSSIDQTAQAAALDIARLRIEKWKVDRDVKQQAQSNADSVSRNLASALPALTAGVRNSPQNFAAAFKLYRNLNALYDVMKSLTESAGAFGSKEEYQSIGQFTANFDDYRRSLGDYLENLSAAKEMELARLRSGATRGGNAQSASGNRPKKIIVDDTAPVSSKAKKKKKATAAPKTAPQ